MKTVGPMTLVELARLFTPAEVDPWALGHAAVHDFAEADPGRHPRPPPSTTGPSAPEHPAGETASLTQGTLAQG